MQFINNKLRIEAHQRIIITHTTSLINLCYLADVQEKQHFRGDINKSQKMAFILSTSCSHALGSRSMPGHVFLVLHKSFKEVFHYLRIKAVIVIRKSN